MTGTAILIRCRTVGEVELDLARSIFLQASIRPIFVANDCGSDGGTEGFAVCDLNQRRLAGLGFAGLPPDWGWRYGDMCLYLARALFPGCARYLLVENDVLFLGEALPHLLDLVRRPDLEAGAARLRLHEAPQKHSRELGKIGLDPAAGCLFPVVFASGTVIDRMAAVRRTALAQGLHKLNDEAILAGTVFGHGFAHADLSAALPCDFRDDCFDTNPPLLREAVLRNPGQGACHPVLSLERILERIADPSRNYRAHRLRRVIKAANPVERGRIAAALGQPED